VDLGCRGSWVAPGVGDGGVGGRVVGETGDLEMAGMWLRTLHGEESNFAGSDRISAIEGFHVSGPGDDSLGVGGCLGSLLVSFWMELEGLIGITPISLALLDCND